MVIPAWLKDIGKGLPYSYGQVLFTRHFFLCGIIMLVTALEPISGLGGLLCILSAMLTARVFQFPNTGIADGSYSFNALLTGLGLGSFYAPGMRWVVMILFAGALCFFLTTWFIRTFSAKYLPYLSLPFLFTLWILLLGIPNFGGLTLREIHESPAVLKNLISISSLWVDELPFSDFFHLYFRSLGAIFFRYHDLAGILLAIGIVVASRLAFLYSLYGFLVGYLFYGIFRGDYTHLVYSYMGFNFILTSIALGGFFIVAHKRTFILLLLAIPAVAICLSGFQRIFDVWNLPLYSLPFNVIVILVLSGLSMRTEAKELQLVTHQYYSLEKNHYIFHHEKNRYKTATFYSLSLPFLGEWTVSQGYNGGITHTDDWKFALDFDVRDEAGKTFDHLGAELTDYYCYQLPVTAPADGYVVTVLDGIPDNEIGKIDMERNWGNSIVLKHGPDIFTKLSHLKPFSILVKEGDYVYRGQVIAYCGSSGRSPEPHLHFQVQYTPYIGSRTIHYPFGLFLSGARTDQNIHFFSVPEEGSIISNLLPNASLAQAFQFIPGRTFSWKNESNGQFEEWEVYNNSLNQTYIYCHTTRSLAWFVNTGIVFYFTHFEGNRQSALYTFFLACQKVVLGFVNKARVKEELSIEGRFPLHIKYLQDFLSPFWHFCKSQTFTEMESPEENGNPTLIHLQTQTKDWVLGKEYKSNIYQLSIHQGKWNVLKDMNKNKAYLCVG